MKPNKELASADAQVSPAHPDPTLQRGWLRSIRSGLARDITLAMLAKIVLLAGLLIVISSRVMQTPHSPAATAQAVAGPTDSTSVPQ